MWKVVLAAGVIWLFWKLWHGNTRPPGTPIPPPPRPMSESEAQARALLGVDADANEKQVRAAHRRLVTAVHPDKGGSEELTRQINAARDTLLRRND
ncbi:J domain-containing protein [Sphingomonas sp. AOB5]|uniref:J domain-containing protein n=1 Tax=Sphingomonas sp. AOB5 TaxID=3034017 RepID=UPI0023F83128|nr:J domain-containing protein [Sphingomonas sp. AOB5]MDF7777015.1 J domain-containing protein [Sphingomonas sp. AOB5]